VNRAVGHHGLSSRSSSHRIRDCRGVDRTLRERKRLLKGHHRLGELTPLFENIAKIVVKNRITAVSRDRIAHVFDRFVEAAGLIADQAEQMKDLRMTGVDHEDVTTSPLRLRDPSRAPVRKRHATGRSTSLACPPCELFPLSFGTPLLSLHWYLIA
jgi:hypothetical protein